AAAPPQHPRRFRARAVAAGTGRRARAAGHAVGTDDDGAGNHRAHGADRRQRRAPGCRNRSLTQSGGGEIAATAEVVQRGQWLSLSESLSFLPSTALIRFSLPLCIT